VNKEVNDANETETTNHTTEPSVPLVVSPPTITQEISIPAPPVDPHTTATTGTSILPVDSPSTPTEEKVRAVKGTRKRETWRTNVLVM
jgi:hypothetical protein